MRSLIISLKAILLFTLISGVLYPLFITGIARAFFPDKANGTLVVNEGKIAGSELIGQKFDSVIYFSSRPSATGYSPLPSGGSNLGITDTRLKETVYTRRQRFINANMLDSLANVPSEMIFASASGLDPHISPQSALMQAGRVASVRNFNADQRKQLQQLIKDQIESPQFLFLGEERINVLWLNLEVDKIK